jgi:UDP-N-acetylglucosamine/UDP-N-acetylgalactosamine diphosphorylase
MSFILIQLYQNICLKPHVDDSDAVIEPLQADKVIKKSGLDEETAKKYRKLGLQKINQGKSKFFQCNLIVAVLILAGGQGTRLGFDFPKGMFNIGLPSKKPIYQYLVERFSSVQKYGMQSNFNGQLGNTLETKLKLKINAYSIS